MDNSIHLVEVTRDQAETWLGHTTFNRPLNKRTVRMLAHDMVKGNWNHLVAPPILIDEASSGVIDGQHRLKALLLSNLESMEAFVLKVPRKAIEVIDTGRPRSLSDTLAIRGHENTVVKSAWLNRGVQWATNVRATHALTRTEAIALIEAAPNIDQAAKVTDVLRRRSNKIVGLPIGSIACLWDIQEYGLGGELVIEFVERVQRSQGLDDLLYRFQKRLLDARNPRSRLTMSGDTESYLIARVFAAWAQEQDLSKIYARRNALYELPGYTEWCEANFADLL
jgi:hypothetical protein